MIIIREYRFRSIAGIGAIADQWSAFMLVIYVILDFVLEDENIISFSEFNCQSTPFMGQ